MSLQFFGRVEINDAEGLLVREMLWVTLCKGRAPLNGFEGLRFQERLQFLGLFFARWKSASSPYDTGVWLSAGLRYI